jgi:hypothetical protein
VLGSDVLGIVVGLAVDIDGDLLASTHRDVQPHCGATVGPAVPLPKTPLGGGKAQFVQVCSHR